MEGDGAGEARSGRALSPMLQSCLCVVDSHWKILSRGAGDPVEEENESEGAESGRKWMN